MKPILPPSWTILFDEFSRGKELLSDIDTFLQQQDDVIFPPPDCIMKAFEMVSPNQVRVVILGQDPYHNPGQAHGLSFSVPDGVKAPPSLKNIFKELKNDLGCDRSQTDLTDWAEQGVLLLNASLTVPLNKPGAHMKEWEPFLDEVMKLLNQQKQSIVFVLWGGFAQSKQKWITQTHHHIIKNVHPSPLSAHRGFFGSKPFSSINALLETPIEWCGKSKSMDQKI